MQLNLHIIQEYLKEIHSEVVNRHHDTTISEIRLYSDHMTMKSDTGYIGASDLFFSRWAIRHYMHEQNRIYTLLFC